MKSLTQGSGRTSILVPSMSYVFGDTGIVLNSTAPFWLTVNYYHESAIDGKEFDEEPVPEYLEISSAILQGVALFMSSSLTLSIKDGTEMIGLIDDRTYDNLVRLLSEQARDARYSDPDLARPKVNERIKQELGFKMIQEEYEY